MIESLLHRTLVTTCVARLVQTAFAAYLYCGLALTTAGAAVAQAPAQLQPLVNDAVAQLQISFRQNHAEQQHRYATIGQVVHAWRNAPHTDANNRLLEEWLRSAIRNSMPGSRTELPAAPQFEQAAAVVAAPPTAPPAAHVEEPARPAVVSIEPTEKIAPASTQPIHDRATPAAVAAHPVEMNHADSDPFVDDPLPAE